MPTDEEYLAAAFNPIIGQPCTQGDEVTLNAPGEAVRIWAR
ncbi:hypothetical protein [Pseudofrankia sp. DC12]|nr:hypothetical protein [Pseudofrankia sp. DC12]